MGNSYPFFSNVLAYHRNFFDRSCKFIWKLIGICKRSKLFTPLSYTPFALPLPVCPFLSPSGYSHLFRYITSIFTSKEWSNSHRCATIHGLNYNNLYHRIYRDITELHVQPIGRWVRHLQTRRYAPCEILQSECREAHPQLANNKLTNCCNSSRISLRRYRLN